MYSDETPIIVEDRVDWTESKFRLIDERKNSIACVLACDGCGKHVTVSQGEYDRFDATLCKECAAKAV